MGYYENFIKVGFVMSDTTKPACKRYMTDDQGNPSSMRLMSMIALFIAGALAFIQVFGKGMEGGNKTELVLYFLVAAFAPKAVQKFAEREPD